MTRSRPISWSQNHRSPCRAATSARAAPPAPMAKASGTQTRLEESGRAVRRQANSTETSSSASHAACPSSQCPAAAAAALATGASAATATCQAAGAGRSAVKSRPAAKHPRNPFSSARGCRKDRYASRSLTGS